jgi:hypothetical protein
MIDKFPFQYGRGIAVDVKYPQQLIPDHSLDKKESYNRLSH